MMMMGPMGSKGVGTGERNGDKEVGDAAHPVDPCGLYTDEGLASSERGLRDSAEGELVERTSLFESKRLHCRTMAQAVVISVQKTSRRIELRDD